MKSFLVFLTLSFVACVAEPGADVEDTDSASSSTLTEMSPEMSFTPLQSTEASPATQSLGCYQIWHCGKCGTRRRNVLHEVCDDGSNTIIYTGPCGEACY